MSSLLCLIQNFFPLQKMFKIGRHTALQVRSPSKGWPRELTLKRRTKEGLDTKNKTEGQEGIYCAAKQPKELPLDIRNK